MARTSQPAALSESRSSVSGTSAQSSALDGQREAHPFAAGIALAAFGHPPDPDEAEADMAQMAALGANLVTLPVLWTSRDIASTKIEPFAYGVPQAAYDAALVEIARRARRRGLEVAIFPIIRLERLGPGEWRGTLKPTDWSAWWDSYRAFILHQAGVAAEAGAAIFCVGSELGTAETDRLAWERLIRDVRRSFRGRILYSANWDHYREVPFWDLVDGIGLSAYYELAAAPGAPQGALDRQWRAHRDSILAWARTIGKPLYLTELGYPAQPGAAVHPWDYTMSEPVDLEAQARCYRAFAAAWIEAPELAGVTIWIWTHDKQGPSDPGYSIAGKPAAAIVREFFDARRRRDPRATPRP